MHLDVFKYFGYLVVIGLVSHCRDNGERRERRDVSLIDTGKDKSNVFHNKEFFSFFRIKTSWEELYIYY